jgi:hypothetical protein
VSETELQPSADAAVPEGATAAEPEPSAPPAAEGGQAGSGDTASEPAAPTSQDMALAQDPRVYQALTEADERQIMAEIEGKALGAMVYSYSQGGGKVTGLSWKGVQEAVRQMNTRQMGRIKIDGTAPSFEEITVEVDTGKTDEDGQPQRVSRRAVRVTVYGIDEVYGSARWGTATQLREFKARKPDKKGNPVWMTDTFADAKALSKAQRNALEGMLPLALVEELKALYLGRGSVEYIDSTAVEITELPPALDDEEAKALGDEIRRLYEAFKREHPKGMAAFPPAEFNRYFVAAQHSHERLGDFKAHMEQRVVEAVDAREAQAAE